MNGVFKPSKDFAFARAGNVMSTESATDFEWSVKINGQANFHVGIASKFKPEMIDINNYDENAIVYTGSLTNSSIRIGSKKIYSILKKHNTGDVICFRFQAHEKKLVIYLVRK